MTAGQSDRPRGRQRDVAQGHGAPLRGPQRRQRARPGGLAEVGAADPAAGGARLAPARPGRVSSPHDGRPPLRTAGPARPVHVPARGRGRRALRQRLPVPRRGRGRQGHGGAGVRARAAVRDPQRAEGPGRALRRGGAAPRPRRAGRRRLRRLRGVPEVGPAHAPGPQVPLPGLGRGEGAGRHRRRDAAGPARGPVLRLQLREGGLDPALAHPRAAARAGLPALRGGAPRRGGARRRPHARGPVLRAAQVHRGAGRLDRLGADHRARRAAAGHHPLALPARALRPAARADDPAVPRAARRRSRTASRACWRRSPAARSPARSRCATASRSKSATRRWRCSSPRCAAIRPRSGRRCRG